MVGSRDYFATASGTFNVTTAQRQPGSSIKPLNYAVGIDRKLVTPASVFLDVPTCYSTPGQPRYCPVNYDGKFHGPVQLRFALGNSFNIPAVKMLEKNGVANFVASTSAFLMTTFKDPSRYGLALTLGGGESTMIEMSQAYTAFANEGVPKKVVAVLKVEDKNGKTLYQFKDPNYIQNIEKPLTYPNFLAISGKKAISKETAFLISHILLDNNARLLEFGPSSALVVPKHTVSVKTGTTDDKRDNWTIGYTPNFLTTVWVGNNDNSPMNQYLASGITGAAPIWNRIMQVALKNQPDLWPRKPDTVVGKQVCYISGAVMNKDAEGKESCPSRFEYFIKGTENVVDSGYEQVKQQVPVNRKTGKLTTQEDPEHDMIEKTIIKGKDMFYCLDCAN
jgi:membrane carboxypeptidase/penicillin-binding protein